MKYALIPILFLVAGCVPNEIHQQDQTRISELLGHIAELQNQVAAIMWQRSGSWSQCAW